MTENIIKVNDRLRKFFESGRRKPNGNGDGKSAEVRTEIERDFDRILFSTPVRRLADKTQVFPLDKNDSVRNRLTHSYEVSNLARSMGVALTAESDHLFKGIEKSQRDVPALLGAIGLVHDLGNPPFGHQGEAAIQSWFIERRSQLKKLFVKKGVEADSSEEFEKLFRDFELFEGNAQGFRLVTRLQILGDEYGLDLTYATLAAMMKYPVASSEVSKSSAASKKHGFFHSEAQIADDVLKKVGLKRGCRHPMAYLMEACDDIAYVVLDAEDSIKKGLASFSDLMVFLDKHKQDMCPLTERVVKQGLKKQDDYRKHGLSPAELNDISMQRFRVFAISEMIHAARVAFLKHKESFFDGSQPKPLLEISDAETLRKALKEFSLKHGYQHKSVLSIELQGYNVIRNLMDMLWFGIDTMGGLPPAEQRKQHPFARYVYNRISENYRRVFDTALKETPSKFPRWYFKCLLLTDMVSGMTDSYAISLNDELNNLKGSLRFDRSDKHK
ncbi:dGTP triphosphohydrolase [Limnobacter sp.]|uniref:dGTP triphosphohydrolase n=1 Tax=Limnobacter sp. TaxID=2003368 RepID=UPI0025C4C7E2|nr:dNTP triphosphohydrolase [Limnobacter sp.]